MANGLAVKMNADQLLEKELRKRALRMEYGFIASSSSTEPWQPIEESYGITRKCLEVISKYRFPVHYLTKSRLVLRDLDLLKEVSRKAILPSDLLWLKHGALITLSISSLDDKNTFLSFFPNTGGYSGYSATQAKNTSLNWRKEPEKYARSTA